MLVWILPSQSFDTLRKMHLLKGFISGLLVLISLLWITIQQIFLPNQFVKYLFIETPGTEVVDFLQLKKDWCRIRSKTISWREMIEPCQQRSSLMSNPRFATNPYLSQVSQVIAKPSGEHTRIRIDTYTNHGTIKSFGGDSFRVYFNGKENVAATVFDLKNGSYEALMLVTTPGTYKLKVILDYTQCHGFNDPPVEWYVQAHCSGKRNNTEIPHDVLSQVTDYINVEISPGITVYIPPAKYNVRDLSILVQNNNCGFSCEKLWDGYGVWTSENQWKSYISSTFKRKSQLQNNNICNVCRKNSQVSKKHKKHSLLWIYGDSISYYFHQRLEKTPICNTRVFKKCRITYNWVYPKTLYELRHFCEDVDVNVQKLREYFRSVIHDKKMDEKSTLIFNLGAHFVKNTSFRKYREIIDAFLEELKSYRGEIIWKSTTAIHEQNIKVMGSFRRYITSQRIQLFNAYANAAACNAGYKFFDIYPITASYPDGPKDGIHYHGNVSRPIELLVNKYFSV